MAKWIKTDGSITEVAPQSKAKKKKFSLEELQAMVGGYIECVYLPERRIMVVNEEGLLKGLAPNLRASVFANQRLVGDCVLLMKGEM